MRLEKPEGRSRSRSQIKNKKAAAAAGLESTPLFMTSISAFGLDFGI
jgi:hypothetical protein